MLLEACVQSLLLNEKFSSHRQHNTINDTATTKATLFRICAKCCGTLNYNKNIVLPRTIMATCVTINSIDCHVLQGASLMISFYEL